MSLNVTRAPSDTIVTLSEARTQCRITSTAHDGLLLRLIDAASSYIETLTGLALTDRGIEYSTNTESSLDPVEIPVKPIISVDSVTYTDPNGTPQSMTADVDYYADIGGAASRLCPAPVWPTTNGSPVAITVAMTAGYQSIADGSTGACPEALRHAVLVMVKDLFDNGASGVSGTQYNEVSYTVEALVSPYRRRYA